LTATRPRHQTIARATAPLDEAHAPRATNPLTAVRFPLRHGPHQLDDAHAHERQARLTARSMPSTSAMVDAPAYGAAIAETRQAGRRNIARDSHCAGAMDDGRRNTRRDDQPPAPGEDEKAAGASPPRRKPHATSDPARKRQSRCSGTLPACGRSAPCPRRFIG
jgi:hypothetical protein